MSSPEKPTSWLVEIPHDRLNEIGGTPAFAALLRLARHVNAFRFAQGAIAASYHDDSPAGVRQRSAAFFYNGGVLFEALKLIPDLRIHFGTNPHWARSFGQFGDDLAVRALVEQGSLLHRIRNHVSFHVLGMVPERSWPTLSLPQFAFVRWEGRATVGAIYYELADIVALHYVLGAPATYEALLSEFTAKGEEVTTRLLAFGEAADILIPRALEAWDLRPRQGPG